MWRGYSGQKKKRCPPQARASSCPAPQCQDEGAQMSQESEGPLTHTAFPFTSLPKS